MQSVKFLLVDDLEENLLSLEALLRRDGLECLMARSGEEALELLLVHDVALAMVDVQMPQMDGFQLAEFMRGAVRARHVPIIFLTAGSGDKQRRFRGYEAGAVDFIQKPIEPDILRSKANVFFELHRQRQQLAAQRDQLEAHAKALRAMEQLTRRELAHEQETARLREQFIAVLGHDLRNPLASIGGAARLLRKEPLSDKGQHVIRLMEASADRMAGLIDDVMDFARGRLGGGIAVERRAHDLEPILRQVVEELEASYPDRVVECDFQLPTQAPVDPGRLSQLVSNLLANALTYGADQAPVRLQAVIDDEELNLSVANSGAPIPKAAMERLFHPFVRGEVQPSQGGLGLGLHIASEIAKAHGGELRASSCRNETRFTLTIPLADAPLASS
jgi:two-component system sensor histidine kinase/response regulator